MKTACALLLASLLVTTVQAAPAPLPKEPRHVPNPECVLERLRGDGFDVSGLKHDGGDRWLLRQPPTAIYGPRFPTGIVVAHRIIIAPGDPTSKIRQCLLERQRR